MHIIMQAIKPYAQIFFSKKKNIDFFFLSSTDLNQLTRTEYDETTVQNSIVICQNKKKRNIDRFIYIFLTEF